MIVGDPKPLKEIAESVSRFRKVLILGCGSCVTVCLSGGDRESHQLAEALSHIRHYESDPPVFNTHTMERQCERDLMESYLDLPPGTDAILSLACGAGVQTVADVYDTLPVVPALNTTFLGAADLPGVWREKCSGCGDCILTQTGGICPVGRCAKQLFNGPCGGSQNGQCEVRVDTPCAWSLIYYRLKKQNQLHRLMEVRAPRDWRSAGTGEPRERSRTGIAGSAGDQSV